MNADDLQAQLLTAKDRLSGVDDVIRRVESERDRQYEFNIAQIAKQAELEATVAQQATEISELTEQRDEARRMARILADQHTACETEVRSKEKLIDHFRALSEESMKRALDQLPKETPCSK